MGHLGQALIRQAKKDSVPIRAVVRKSSDAGLLKGFCSEVVSASLEDTESLTRAFTGCEAVIHAAAMIDIRRGHGEIMHRVNVEGTARVVKACRDAGVRRLVYISSIEAVNLKNPLRPITENHGFADGNAVMQYGETKAEASRLVKQAATEGGLEAVLICPTGIMGPYDPKEGLLTTMVKRFVKGRIPACIPGGFDYVDVRDVAAAALASVDKGRNGECYIISGEYLSVKEMYDLIEDLSTSRHFTPGLPLPLARFAAFFSELWSDITGRQALFTRGSIEILQLDARMDNTKARSDLGYSPRPLREAMADTLEWLAIPVLKQAGDGDRTE